MRQRSSTLVLLAFLAASGCSTPPTKFYTLSAVREGAAAGAAAGGRVVAVGPISIPDYVDRPGIVVRENENQVRVASFDQWAGSLQDMLSRVLREDLAARLPGDRIVAFPQVEDVAFTRRVAIEITRFDVSASGEAVVGARWQIHDRGGAPAALNESEARAQAAGSTYDQRVAALSQALAQLADEVARGLTPVER